MTEGGIPVLPIPARKVTRHRVMQLDRDNIRGREAAAPFFDAGGISMALAELPDYRGSLHIPSCHRFYLILQGRMKIRLGADTSIASPGDLVCMPAGVTACRTGLGPIVVIYIELEDIPLWGSLKTLGPSVRKYESTDLLYILVSRLTSALRSQDVYSIRCALENAEMLVKLLKRELQQSTNEWTSDRMKRLVDLLDSIRAKPDHNWDLPAMARNVNMSERNLSRTFQRVFNMPPARMVIILRMDLASKMLIKTDKTINAIANAVGYSSPFSFSRLFRKYTGISPMHYRELPADQRHSIMSAAAKTDIQIIDQGSK